MARYFHTGPSAEELAAVGMRPEDVEAPPPVALWPDIAEVWDLYMAARTQWMVGPSGTLLGLNYGSLPLLFRVCKIAEEDEAETLRLLQIAEIESINISLAQYKEAMKK